MSQERYETVESYGPLFSEFFGEYCLENTEGLDIIIAKKNIRLVRESVLIADAVDDIIHYGNKIDMDKRLNINSLNLERLRLDSKLRLDLGWTIDDLDYFSSNIITKLDGEIPISVGEFTGKPFNKKVDLKTCLNHIVNSTNPEYNH